MSHYQSMSTGQDRDFFIPLYWVRFEGYLLFFHPRYLLLHCLILPWVLSCFTFYCSNKNIMTKSILGKSLFCSHVSCLRPFREVKAEAVGVGKNWSNEWLMLSDLLSMACLAAFFYSLGPPAQVCTILSELGPPISNINQENATHGLTYTPIW